MSATRRGSGFGVRRGPLHDRRIGARLGPLLLAGLVIAWALPSVAAAALLAVANDDAYTTPYETRLEVDEPGFLGNDLNVVGSTDPEVTDEPNHGELDLHGHDGRFDYTPDDGFSGVDSFTYRLTTLLVGSTSATVRITVGPRPTPTPTPTPKPTPTPTPTPKPTASPTPTPTPRPSIIVLPSLEVPLPSLRILPTPTPTPTPTPASSLGTTPGPSVGPSNDPGPTPSPFTIAAAGGTGDGPAGPGTSSGPDAAPVFDLPAAGDEGLSSSVEIETGLAVPPTFLVPTLAFTVPGLLLILAVLAQGAGALAWIPFVRRTLDDDERDRRRRRARAGSRR